MGSLHHSGMIGGSVTPLKLAFGRLHALKTDKSCSVSSRCLSFDHILGLVYRWHWRRSPRSGLESTQLTEEELTAHLRLTDGPDFWSCLIDDKRVFSVSGMRNYISEVQDQGHALISFWNKFVPSKVNILSWRIGQKRLSTRLNLDHRGIDLDSLLCPCCNEDQESELHLFGACEVASSLWEAVFSWWGLTRPPMDIVKNILLAAFSMSLQPKVLVNFVRRFKDSSGDFMGFLKTDLKGLINLYEASYLAFKGERDLHEAKLFATEYLPNFKSQEYGAHELINHALELPLYRRMLRLEARWYIDAYSKRKDANILILELATLDFNMVQSELKTELQELSKWWKSIGLASNLSFVRDRLMECFFWTVGIVFEPQYSSCRVGLTKVAALITVIDDIYDVYGSLDELKIFTDCVKRWDNNAIEHMPEYLQVGYQALYNTVNDLGSNTPIALPILVKEWGDLLEAFYVEARWTHNKYIPTLEDYLNNAWRSVSGVVILTHGYFLINKETKKDMIESLEKYHELLKWSSTIFRLCNDLGTSSDEIKQGKTANAISCYMHENGACEEVAREYIKDLIDEAWRKMIKAQVGCSQESGDPFIDMAINLARISHCTYQYGDGHGAPDARAKDTVMRWQKKMHFMLFSMSVVYVLTTPMPEDGGENPTVEQVRKRAKWDNNDYVCRDTLKAKYMAEDASSKKFLVSNFINYKMTNSRPVLEQYNKLLGILGRFTQHNMNMDESIKVSCIIDKLPPSWKDFKHTLKHLKEELIMIELGSHLRIEESLRAQDNDKPKGNNVAGPSVVNMVEHNNSSRYNDNKGKRKHHDTRANPNKKPKVTCWKCGKPGHLKRIAMLVMLATEPMDQAQRELRMVLPTL
ncbi:(E)-beta-ocimene synthase, chloroplastic-like protein [Tanacetum coccineum]